MSVVDDKMNERISLHGLGFIQVVLGGHQRLHVWHPDLPRRKCFKDSAVHDHRFSFNSRILVGNQRNIIYDAKYHEEGDYMAYLHNGPRSANGGRPWVPNGRLDLWQRSDTIHVAGTTYSMRMFEFHQSVPSGDGRVATLMTKLDETKTKGAQSICRFGVEPDSDFNRFQLKPKDLWAYVVDVLGTGNLDGLSL